MPVGKACPLKQFLGCREAFLCEKFFHRVIVWRRPIRHHPVFSWCVFFFFLFISADRWGRSLYKDSPERSGIKRMWSDSAPGLLRCRLTTHKATGKTREAKTFQQRETSRTPISVPHQGFPVPLFFQSCSCSTIYTARGRGGAKLSLLTIVLEIRIFQYLSCPSS